MRLIPLTTVALSVVLFAAAPAMAQQLQNDIQTLQRTISVLEQQRNNAANAAVMAETRAMGLQNDLAKAQASETQAQGEIKRLKEKYEPKENPPKKE